MLADEYLRSVLASYDLPSGPGSPVENAEVELATLVKEWAGRYLMGIEPCGSYATGTRVKGGTDIDLLVALGPRTPLEIPKLYDRLFAFIKCRNHKPERQSISIGLTWHGLKVDLIPARQEWGGNNDYTVFETARLRTTKTNFGTHIKAVRDSGRVGEIRLLKIWRDLRHLRFPSFCLELVVIDALKRRPTNQPADNMLGVFEYLHTVFPGAPMRDPANRENIVSDDMLKHEKLAISDAAVANLRQKDWNKIVW